MSTGQCPDGLCSGGACQGASLGPLLSPQVMWLWEQLANRADKRGDPDMTSGSVTITAPVPTAERAAVLGLLGTHALRPGQSRRVDLPDLTSHVRRRGPALTPGAVTAHAVRRPLGENAAARARAAARTQSLRSLHTLLTEALPEDAPLRPPETAWADLQRSGWVSRIVQHPSPELLLRAMAQVLARLPAYGRADRRLLAHTATGDPHAMDAGSELGGLVLAEAAGCGALDPGLSRRAAWDRIGVDCDTLTGGLLSLNVLPEGWQVPAGEPVTLPPRTLQRARWPSAETEHPAHRWVFVTENPSVLAAALDQPGHDRPIRLLCTVGTPSAAELSALRQLAASGWQIAVRADFDTAGLAHVRAVLDTVPDAEVWRMTAADYTASLHPAPLTPSALDAGRIGDTPWDPQLATAMHACGRPAYEEALIDQLLRDMRQGHPSQSADNLTSRDRCPSAAREDISVGTS
ncbi:DUF2399 domain-containing protein [Streptomyces sp. NPDC060366]|uniref:DUF2399 domain-containing protein n=1 Tax=Streptomyces sp. NPDC060366 TaxID=3347105 RepID=UPI00365BB55D